MAGVNLSPLMIMYIWGKLQMLYSQMVQVAKTNCLQFALFYPDVYWERDPLEQYERIK